MKRKLMIPAMLLIVLTIGACQKDFLDTKPNKALLVPTTLSDMQALLDNIAIFNISPALTAVADGDFYTTDAGWKAWNTDGERNSYSWNADIFGVSASNDWTIPYQQVFYANIVLDGLADIAINAANQSDYNAIKGAALFSRAFANYNLLQEFTLPYQAATAGSDLGIPIRLKSDVSLASKRATVQESYDQVIKDLQAARFLLPATSVSKSRPILAAGFALLARVNLATGNFVQAGKYADSCLQQRNALIDYNTLSTTAARPFPRAVPTGNDEVIYYASAISFSANTSAATVVDTTLFRSYATNDLRKTILFKASGLSGTFKGNYAGIVAVFSGLATDEMYLVRAEAAARQGQTAAAMADLNTLLLKRWKTGTFVPFTAADAEAALKLVINERRKELVGRFLRWPELRRLNTDNRFKTDLTRKINGQTYSLAAGSKRYAYPIPFDEVTLSGLIQNER